MANLIAIEPFITTLIVLAIFAGLSIMFIMFIRRHQKHMRKDKYMLINDFSRLSELLKLIDYRIKNSKDTVYFTLLLASIDDYTNIRNIINPEGAEEYLSRVLESLRRELPIGGKIAQTEEVESFLIYIPEYYDEDGMHDIAQRFKNSMEKKFYVGNSVPIHKTASVAVTAFPEQGQDVVELINNLLISIYTGKKAGGDELVYYSKELEKSKQYTDRYKDIKEAIDIEQIRLNFHPIVNIDNEEVEGGELVINQLTASGTVEPIADFIHYLEEYNDDFWFMMWSVERAILMNKEVLNSAQAENFFITVKTGFNFLTNEDAAIKLHNLLTRYNIDTNNVILEVEGILNNELGNRLVKYLMQMQGLGIRIAAVITDTNRNMAKLIETFDVDFIKISVADALNTNKKWVQELFKLSYNYRKKVIVTDVESVNQIDKLKNKTVMYVQGPHYGLGLGVEQLHKLRRQ